MMSRLLFAVAIMAAGLLPAHGGAQAALRPASLAGNCTRHYSSTARLFSALCTSGTGAYRSSARCVDLDGRNGYYTNGEWVRPDDPSFGSCRFGFHPTSVSITKKI